MLVHDYGLFSGGHLLGIDSRLASMTRYGDTLAWVLIILSLLYLSLSLRLGIIGLITAALWFAIGIPRF